MSPMLLHVSGLLTAACIAGLWQGLVITLMGVALCGLMPRASATLRHALLMVLFAGALVLPWISFQRLNVGSGHRGVLLAPWLGVAVAAVWITAVAFRGFQLYLA